MYYLKNTNFWMFGLFFFFYFFIMGAYFPFFPIWLHDINHISKSDTGIIFAAISLFSLLFQPLFGLLSDKLGLRKYLLWIITGMLVMFAPFFIFIFGPLLQYNILVGSIVGGILPTIEAHSAQPTQPNIRARPNSKLLRRLTFSINASTAGAPALKQKPR